MQRMHYRVFVHDPRDEFKGEAAVTLNPGETVPGAGEIYELDLARKEDNRIVRVACRIIEVDSRHHQIWVRIRR